MPLDRMTWAAAEGRCIKTLIVGVSRVLDFNIDLCALQTLAQYMTAIMLQAHTEAQQHGRECISCTRDSTPTKHGASKGRPSSTDVSPCTELWPACADSSSVNSHSTALGPMSCK